MKLKSIETFDGRFICFVRVTDTDGDCGWGMTAPFDADITAQILHRLAAGIAFEPFDDHELSDISDKNSKAMSTT